MAFARVNGVVIHYDLRGPAEKPAVVFSNSLGTDFRIGMRSRNVWSEIFGSSCTTSAATGSRKRPRSPMR